MYTFEFFAILAASLTSVGLLCLIDINRTTKLGYFSKKEFWTMFAVGPFSYAAQIYILYLFYIEQQFQGFAVGVVIFSIIACYGAFMGVDIAVRTRWLCSRGGMLAILLGELCFPLLLNTILYWAPVLKGSGPFVS
jgi:hypothetical protein